MKLGKIIGGKIKNKIERRFGRNKIPGIIPVNEMLNKQQLLQIRRDRRRK